MVGSAQGRDSPQSLSKLGSSWQPISLEPGRYSRYRVLQMLVLHGIALGLGDRPPRASFESGFRLASKVRESNKRQRQKPKEICIIRQGSRCWEERGGRHFGRRWKPQLAKCFTGHVARGGRDRAAAASSLVLRSKHISHMARRRLVTWSVRKPIPARGYSPPTVTQEYGDMRIRAVAAPASGRPRTQMSITPQTSCKANTTSARTQWRFALHRLKLWHVPEAGHSPWRCSVRIAQWVDCERLESMANELFRVVLPPSRSSVSQPSRLPFHPHQDDKRYLLRHRYTLEGSRCSRPFTGTG